MAIEVPRVVGAGVVEVPRVVGLGVVGVGGIECLAVVEVFGPVIVLFPYLIVNKL